jgi:hypothetical protein
VSTNSAITTTKADYVEQKLESDQGAQNVGVQLALYFHRVAPTISNKYSILADPNLLEAAQTIFSLPPAASTANIDAQAHAFKTDADFRPAKAEDAAAAHRALYCNVRSELWARLGRDDVARGGREFEFDRVGRHRDSRKRHQFERTIDRQRARRANRRFDPDVFERTDVEPAEVFARRMRAPKSPKFP